MKKAIQILMVVIAAALVSACGDSKINRLKSQVASINKSCPMDMGIGGSVISVEYNDEDGNVYINYASTPMFETQFASQSNRDNIKENMKLMMLNDDSHEWLEAIVEAGAGVVMTYKLPSSGETVRIEIPADEIRSIGGGSMSDRERALLIVGNKANVDNGRCPVEIAPGMTMVSDKLENGELIFEIDVDESVQDMTDWDELALRHNIMGNFEALKNDPSIQNEFKLLTTANVGYHYVYRGLATGKRVDVVLTPKDLKRFL